MITNQQTNIGGVMKKIILVLTFLTLPLSSYAQDAFYVSGLLGLGQLDINVNEGDFGSELNYGVRAGLLFNDHVAAGLFYLRSDNEKTISTNAVNATISSDFNPLMAEVVYYFNEADENSFYLSGMLGIADVGLNSENETAVGASAGYNFMLAPNYSLAPQLTYIKTLGENDKDATHISALINFTIWL